MLNITFKDLNCQTYSLEIDDSLTVKDLKEKLHEKRGLNYSADKQVMIYDGKVLTEDSVISTLKIDPEKFVVVMKQKAVCKEYSTTPAVSKPDIKESGDGTKKKSKEHGSKSHIGKKKDKTNSPSSSSSSSSPSPSSSVAADSTCPMSSSNLLSGLQNNADFIRIRNLLDRDPTQINAVVEHITRSCPDLLDVISKNRESFFEMMGVDKATMMLYEGAGRGIAGANQPVANGEGAAVPGVRQRSPARRFEPESTTSRLVRNSGRSLETHEIEAIERLKSMGFDEQMVIQAYFACEKDENAAANFLLQQHDD